MSELPDPEAIGPVDIAVIAFDGSEFNGEVAPALAELHDSGTVRIIDLAFMMRDEDGGVTIVEVEDADVADAFERLNSSHLDLLNDEDLDALAAGLQPGSSAMVIVWENSWLSRFASAVRGSHGEVIYLERIPRDSVLAAIDALNEE